MTSAKWDAFRSFRRATQEQTADDPGPGWWSSNFVKLLILIWSHTSLITGTLITKTLLHLLSSNIIPETNFCRGSSNVKTASLIINIGFAILLIQAIPDVISVLRGIYCLFTRAQQGNVITMFILLEGARAFGLAMFYLRVAPLLDPIHSVVLVSVPILVIPNLGGIWDGLCEALSWSTMPGNTRMWLFALVLPPYYVLLTVLCNCLQWSIINPSPLHLTTYLCVIAFLSLGSWEYWIDRYKTTPYLRPLYRMKYGLRKLSDPTRIMTGVFRILIALAFYELTLRTHGITYRKMRELLMTGKHGSVVLIGLAVVVVNYFMRYSSRFLASMGMSVLPIVNPLLIGPPMIAVAFGASCGYVDTCSINQLLERFDLQWQCHKRLESNLKGTTGHLLTVTLIVYVLWTIIHLFNRQGPARNKSQNVIDSMSPMLSPFTIETSTEVYHYLLKTDGKEEDDILHEGDEFYDTLTLYICATMWHETKNEMAQMIKSIIRLDEEQDRRKNLKAETEGAHFVLESHIFFDDAWEDLPECGRVPNSYFRQLFELLIELTTVDEDAVAAEGERILVTTPYGGRLVMQLPAGTLLFVHLKDKKLMRHKKRWSQVMYMYYLLGHRIMDTHLTIEDRQHRADNTFIMAIDGDSKFEPHSVIRLLNLMRTKADIGCACGRIHPIGNGVMVWYQKFEYAIAHWFQKAAEHVFGCVLCAPGCFSLFRASALMDDNIMHKYTKMATEPRHFVQYDQGEDRWLSTLILKQGYRIEYDAGADAETYAPEGFEEFFNQRRRWTPSSVANTIDLLADYKRASQNNDSISKLYIIYQMLVIGFSLLGPAIIFAMLVFAQVAAFGTDPTWMMVYNTVPVSLFIAACFVFESKWQLLFAKIASVVYAFIMLAVLVATSSQIVLETAFSPTSIFVLAMIGIFFVAALLHPHEFYNIIFGLIFFLMIPSTYVFLSFYALINLNVINWGTREAVAKATGQAKEKKKAEKSSWMTRWEETMGIIGRMFPCCGRSSEKDVLDKLDSKLAKLDELIVKMEKGGVPTAKVTKEDAVLEDNNDNKDKKREALHAQFASARLRLEDLSENKNQWMESEYLENCDRGKLKPSEEHFWDELIEKYLKPIRSTPEEQLEHAKGLVHLRNKVAFGLILLNGLLVLAIFLLQKHKDVLSVQWKPYDGFKWTKMNDRTGQYESTDEALQVDPLGMGIIFFLMGILIVQSIGLIIHRVNTMVRGMHEAAQVEEIFVSNRKRKYDYDGIIESVRAMIDTEIYEEEAHGTRGYKRVSPTGETESRVTNVLYKLDRDTSDFEEERNPNRI